MRCRASNVVSRFKAYINQSFPASTYLVIQEGLSTFWYYQCSNVHLAVSLFSVQAFRRGIQVSLSNSLFSAQVWYQADARSRVFFDLILCLIYKVLKQKVSDKFSRHFCKQHFGGIAISVHTSQACIKESERGILSNSGRTVRFSLIQRTWAFPNSWSGRSEVPVMGLEGYPQSLPGEVEKC